MNTSIIVFVLKYDFGQINIENRGVYQQTKQPNLRKFVHGVTWKSM